jgi:hypothetical protein
MSTLTLANYSTTSNPNQPGQYKLCGTVLQAICNAMGLDEGGHKYGALWKYFILQQQ